MIKKIDEAIMEIFDTILSWFETHLESAIFWAVVLTAALVGWWGSL